MAEKKIWNKKNTLLKSKLLHYPVTSVIRSIFSDKYFKYNKKIENLKILDVGTLYLNNVIPFKQKKCKLYGLEVTKDSVQIAKSIAIKTKTKINLKLGDNRNIPFGDNFFDVLLSINTIHYEESLTNINLALKEFARVLKPNGLLFLETVAPKHGFYKNTNYIGKNIYINQNKKDIRYHNKFFFFKNKNEINKIFKKKFKKLEISRITESYPKETLDFFDVKCFNVKKI